LLLLLTTAAIAITKELTISNLKNLRFELSANTFIVSGTLLVALVLFSTTTSWWWSDYARAFPILDAELGLGWNRDTVFHVSLIQSILNFGYPSIAQHEHPLLAYHVLSHYLDALIVIVTGVEPYDSYGLFFHYKIFIFLSAILIFIGFVTRKNNIFVFLAAFIIFIPCAVGTWHAIGSHGLWFGSLVLILAMPFIASTILQEDQLQFKTYLILFAIITIISFSKISSGFMLAAFVGSCLLIKEPKRVHTYVFGGAIFLFFYLYGSIFILQGNQLDPDIQLSMLGLGSFWNYLLSDHVRNDPQVTSAIPGILSCILVFFTVYCSKPTHSGTRSVLVGSSLAVITLYVVTTVRPSFGTSDIWYFQYGLSSVLVTFTLPLIISHLNSLNLQLNVVRQLPAIYFTLWFVAFTCLALLTRFFPLPAINLFSIMDPRTLHESYDFLKNGHYKELNKSLTDQNKLSTFSSFEQKKELHAEIVAKAKVFLPMRNEIRQIVQNANSEKSAIALIPTKQFYTKFSKIVGGAEWGQGLLLYAATGVPLHYGVNGFPSGYGFSKYNEGNSPRDFSEINRATLCQTNKISAFLVYKDLPINENLTEDHPEIIMCK
tara:strand:- start:6194 stop:8002 length:1809 start_codon:yes stop_codon:yes gene_type:complete